MYKDIDIDQFYMLEHKIYRLNIICANDKRVYTDFNRKELVWLKRKIDLALKKEMD